MGHGTRAAHPRLRCLLLCVHLRVAWVAYDYVSTNEVEMVLVLGASSGGVDSEGRAP